MEVERSLAWELSGGREVGVVAFVGMAVWWSLGGGGGIFISMGMVDVGRWKRCVC